MQEWKVHSIQVDDELLNDCEVLLYLDFLILLIVTKEMVLIAPIVTKEMVSIPPTSTKEMVEMSVSHRIIQIPLDLRKIISLSAHNKRISEVTVQGIRTEMKPECKVYSNINNENIYITYSEKIRQLICKYCVLNFKGNFFLESTIFEEFMRCFDTIEFSCLWNCGEFYSVANLMNHELNYCKKNRSHFKCRIPGFYLNACLYGPKKHLHEHAVTMYDRYVILDKNSSKNENSYQISPRPGAFCIWIHPKFITPCQVTYVTKYLWKSVKQ